MSESEVKVWVFRGSDEDQFESYVHFFDTNGNKLTTKHLCIQKSESHEEYTEDSQVLDLAAFYFYEWGNVGRVECHSDLKDICLSPKLRPKIGTIEFLDERKKDLVKRGRYSMIDEEDEVTQYDISNFFSMMSWDVPAMPVRNVDYQLFDKVNFPVSIQSSFGDREFSATVRFYDAQGNEMDLKPFRTHKDYETEHVFEEWQTINLPEFLKKMWMKVAVIECRADLSSLDRFRYVKGDIDYLIYCKANNYKKLPEYLYKRIQTKKLDQFLKDLMVGI